MRGKVLRLSTTRSLALFCIIGLLACQGPSQDTVKQSMEKMAALQKEVQALLDQTQKALRELSATRPPDMNPDLAIAEVDKLRQFEYRVLEFSDSASAEDLAAQLNKAGAEFWECFSSQAIDSGRKIQFYCKRRPSTPLRFVPQTLLGR